MLDIRLGHDLQFVEEFAGIDALRLPGIFFTAAECAYFTTAKSPVQSMAGHFSAKEALFKALPEVDGLYWPDIEIDHDWSGAPRLNFTGKLQRFMQRHGLVTRVCISHSGSYVSSVVLITPFARRRCRCL